MSKSSDVIIIGAGGAGMMCAIRAGKRGRSVVLLDHSAKLGGKILISGGGRCNFTNIGASPRNYVSKNPHFCKSAFSRFKPEDFIEMVERHNIAYHEKKLGQLFCDGSAQAIVDMLKRECEEVGAEIFLDCKIDSVKPIKDDETFRFSVTTSKGEFRSHSLVIATGGLSIPKIGATGFGYSFARKLGLNVIEQHPALDGFVFNANDSARFEGLSGVSVDCMMTAGGVAFRENLLFTHAGLSGPATLQASLHWNSGEEVIINFLPDQNLFEFFLEKKKQGNRSTVKNLLCEKLPTRLAERLCELGFQSNLPLPQVSEKALKTFCDTIHAFSFIPESTVGYSKAEVTRGGVDTEELSSKTMESKKIPGLYFIGEVVDVTGWLGGYNFHWAWASGAAAGDAV